MGPKLNGQGSLFFLARDDKEEVAGNGVDQTQPFEKPGKFKREPVWSAEERSCYHTDEDMVLHYTTFYIPISGRKSFPFHIISRHDYCWLVLGLLEHYFDSIQDFYCRPPEAVSKRPL